MKRLPTRMSLKTTVHDGLIRPSRRRRLEAPVSSPTPTGLNRFKSLPKGWKPPLFPLHPFHGPTDHPRTATDSTRAPRVSVELRIDRHSSRIPTSANRGV